jgi:PilZ domain
MDSPRTLQSTSALTEPNRRRYPRHAAQIQIELREQGNDVPMRLATADISRAGCYIEMMMPLAVGTQIQATLWLDTTPIVVHGHVVTCHPQFGNGIVFEKFEGEAEQILQEYVDAIVS